MQTPRFEDRPISLNSAPYHYLGLTDYVELERAARRLRAQALAAALTGMFRRLHAGIARRVTVALEQSRAKAELYALDDRTLRDMGLSRSAIPAAVAGTLTRPAPVSNENAKVAVLKPQADAAA